MTINRKIAFEFDKVRPTEAMSVIIHGQARELYTDEERDFFDTLPLRPWVSTEKYHYLEITPDQVSGRRFLLRSVNRRLSASLGRGPATEYHGSAVRSRGSLHRPPAYDVRG